MATKPARKRRTAEQAKEEILAVATRQLRDQGVAGLRLDEIAAEIGVSRQAVLHHFGSREGLVREVVRGAWTGLFQDLLGLLAAEGDPSAITARDLIERVDDVTRRKGNARLGAWLLLSDQGLPSAMFEGAVADLPKALADSRGTSLEDMQFGILLLASALFGDAVFGGRFRQALGLPDTEDDRRRFHHWLAERLSPPTEQDP
jgi:AcrR family transcriptional regulator